MRCVDLISLQVANSLTARSVPRVVRQDLSAGPVRITRDSADHNKVRVNVDDDCYVKNIHLYQVHIVYDSRSDSPEHVGIPAVPVKVFSARQPSAVAGETGGYTSDESQGNNSRGNTRANTRRHKLNKKEKIIWA